MNARAPQSKTILILCVHDDFACAPGHVYAKDARGFCHERPLRHTTHALLVGFSVVPPSGRAILATVAVATGALLSIGLRPGLYSSIQTKLGNMPSTRRWAALSKQAALGQDTNGFVDPLYLRSLQEILSLHTLSCPKRRDPGLPCVGTMRKTPWQLPSCSSCAACSGRTGHAILLFSITRP